MPNFYCYEMPWGFMTCDLDTEEAPAEYANAWSVTPAVAELIEEGADIQVHNDSLVVVPVAQLEA